MKATMADYVKIGVMVAGLVGSAAVTQSQVTDLRARVATLDSEGARGSVQAIESLRGDVRVLANKIDTLHELIERSELRRSR